MSFPTPLFQLSADPKDNESETRSQPSGSQQIAQFTPIYDSAYYADNVYALKKPGDPYNDCEFPVSQFTLMYHPETRSRLPKWYLEPSGGASSPEPDAEPESESKPETPAQVDDSGHNRASPIIVAADGDSDDRWTTMSDLCMGDEPMVYYGRRPSDSADMTDIYRWDENPAPQHGHSGNTAAGYKDSLASNNEVKSDCGISSYRSLVDAYYDDKPNDGRDAESVISGYTIQSISTMTMYTIDYKQLEEKGQRPRTLLFEERRRLNRILRAVYPGPYPNSDVLGRCTVYPRKGGKIAYAVPQATNDEWLTLFEYTLGMDHKQFWVHSVSNLFTLSHDLLEDWKSGHWILLPPAQDTRDFIQFVMRAISHRQQGTTPTTDSSWRDIWPVRRTYEYKLVPLQRTYGPADWNSIRPTDDGSYDEYPLTVHVSPPFAIFAALMRVKNWALEERTTNFVGAKEDGSKKCSDEALEDIRALSEAISLLKGYKESSLDWAYPRRHEEMLPLSQLPRGEPTVIWETSSAPKGSPDDENDHDSREAEEGGLSGSPWSRRRTRSEISSSPRSECSQRSPKRLCLSQEHEASFHALTERDVPVLQQQIYTEERQKGLRRKYGDSKTLRITEWIDAVENDEEEVVKIKPPTTDAFYPAKTFPATWINVAYGKGLYHLASAGQSASG